MVGGSSSLNCLNASRRFESATTAHTVLTRGKSYGERAICTLENDGSALLPLENERSAPWRTMVLRYFLWRTSVLHVGEALFCIRE